MRIGELAERVGTSTRALRHYEAQGLLRARRDANGYRDYGEDDLRLVEEIRSLQAIGFTLEETRPFVDSCAPATTPATRARTRSRCTGASSPTSTPTSPAYTRSVTSSPRRSPATRSPAAT